MAAIAILITIIISHIFIISRLIFFPYPELFIYPYLTNLGLLPYAQILDQHFPGLMFLPINLGNLGMVSTEAAKLTHFGTIAVVHVLIFWITSRLLKNKKSALVANMFFLLWHPYFEGNTLWIDSFLPLLLLPAFLFFYNKKYLASGLFLGLALAMKQVVLPLILLLFIYIYLIENKKLAIKFLAISAIPMGLVSLYFFNLGIFNDFFYWTVTFNLTTFAQMGRKYATFNEIIKVGFVFAPAFLYLIFNLKKQRQAFLLAVFVSGTLLFAYARFDLIHLQPVLPFIAIASALFVGKLLKPLRANLIIIYILIAIIPLFKHYGRLRGDTTRFLGQKENTLAAQIIDLTQDGDPILALATTPHIYKMTHTRPAGNIFVFNFPWFLVETDARIAAAIKNDPPKLVIRDKTATTSNINLYEYMPEIAKFVDQNYELAVKIETIEILLPKK